MKIAKATIAVSPVAFSNVIVGFVRSKFTAIVLGTRGVGLFAQAFNFLNFFVSFGSLGMRLGITKYVSKYSSEKKYEETAKIIALAVRMQLAVSILFLVVIGLFAPSFSKYLFASGVYSFYVVIMAIGLPFTILAGTFESIILGFGSYKDFARGRVIFSALSLIPLFLFIGIMRIDGAFWYLVAAAIINFLIFYHLLLKIMPLQVSRDILSVKSLFGAHGEGRKLAKMLLSYGGTSFITGGIGLFCLVFTRTLLINYFGLEANGIYQVVFAISSYYLALFTNGIWSYFYPKASAITDGNAYMSETNQAFRFCILGVLPIIVSLYLLRYILPSADLFSTQLFGDIFFLLFYLFGTSLLAREKLKAYTVVAIAYGVSFIGLFIILAPHIAVKAMTCSYLLSNLLGVALLGIYHLKILRIRISTQNITLLIGAVMVVALVFFAGGSGPVWFFGKSVFFIAAYLVFLTGEEKRRIFRYLLSKTGRSQG
jgi:PST family polysaccharide transporter